MADVTAPDTTTSSCCAPEQQASCCESSAKVDCCGHGDGCGCDAGNAKHAHAGSAVVRAVKPVV